MGKRRALKNRRAQGVDQGGERQSLDCRVEEGRESLVGKEDAGENPHRHHHEVDQPTHRFDFLRAAGGEEADPAEAERPQ